MNFNTMNYFMVAAAARNFTKAAEHLHITQQTLSAGIAGLEKELGVRLFVRRVPLELTYEGEVFRKYAEHFLDEYQQLQHEFEEIRNEQRGILRVGVAYTRGRTIMPEIIAAFQKDYPHYEVELVEGSNEDLRAWTADGIIDLAIGIFNSWEPGIDLFPFYNEEILLLIAKDLFQELYGAAAHETLAKLKDGDLSVLGACPFVLGHPEDVSGSVSRLMLKSFRLNPEIRATSDNIETLLAMCVRSVGACFCPDKLLTETLSREQIEKLHIISLNGEAHYQIRFGIRKQTYQRHILRVFMDAARTAGTVRSS